MYFSSRKAALDQTMTADLIGRLRRLAEDIENGRHVVDTAPCVLSSGYTPDEFDICLLAHSRVVASEDASKKLSKLTPKQLLVLMGMIRGHSAKVIAADLGVSRRTIENHVAAIHRTTETRRVSEVVGLVYARLF